MVFNCIAVNQDDHVKNISFLMDRNGEWKLSPAYDITFSYNPANKWLRAHQMTINNKNRDIQFEDLMIVGASMGIKKKKCMDIISRVGIAVGCFEKFAMEANIRESTYSNIKNILNQNTVNI